MFAPDILVNITVLGAVMAVFCGLSVIKQKLKKYCRGLRGEKKGGCCGAGA